MNTATNQVVEGQMSAINAAPITQQKSITGQYLYDNFVSGAGEENITKMTIVRLMAQKNTIDDVKAALKDMIEIAHKHDIKAGVPEKERGPKWAAAMNSRSVMQNVYGALTRARKEMDSQGYTEKTGYLDASNMAKTALKKHGTKWDGTQLKTDETRAQAEIQREKELRQQSTAQAMSELTQEENEDDLAFFQRVKARAAELIEKQTNEVEQRVISNLAQKLVKTCGSMERYEAVANRMLANLAALRQATEQVEPSKEEMDMRFKALFEAEEAQQTEEEEENA